MTDLNDFEQPCSECSEHGNLYCRMCQKRYCFDHSCWHLNAAQKSYTERNKDEHEQILSIKKESNNGPSGREIHLHRICPIQQTTLSDLSCNVKNMERLSEEQLREYYTTALQLARQYRSELERRAAPFARTFFGEQATKEFGRKLKEPKPKKERRMAKSKVMALEYLTQQIKLGNIKPEDIERRLL